MDRNTGAGRVDAAEHNGGPADDRIENRTIGELAVGDVARLTRTLTYRDIEIFAIMSGDVNPAHVDHEFARSDIFHTVIAHGMWGGALISTVLGTELPGPGTIYLEQTLRFSRPVVVGDTVTVTVAVAAVDRESRRVTLDCSVVNQRGKTVIDGTATVLAPVEKVSRPRVLLPELELRDHGRHLRRLIERATDHSNGRTPLRTAVVHPVDAESLQMTLEAAAANLITPVLVGPRPRIEAAADAAGIDLHGIEIIATEHSHAAAAQAVAMAVEHRVDLIVQGALGTDELLTAMVRETRLHTSRRMSHALIADVPDLPKPVLVTDAMVNVTPALEAKRDIVQNAVDLAHSMGTPLPKVAVLAAVDTVVSHLPSTLDAAVLCKMADRGQIRGAVVEGPLAVETAVTAAGHAFGDGDGVRSGVAGDADVLVAPDLESGAMLASQLQHLADAQMAGLLLGARVPVVLTSRFTSRAARVASCAVAVLHRPKPRRD